MRTTICTIALAALLALPTAALAMQALEPDGSPTPVPAPKTVTPPKNAPPAPSKTTNVKPDKSSKGHLIIRTAPKKGMESPAGTKTQ